MTYSVTCTDISQGGKSPEGVKMRKIVLHNLNLKMICHTINFVKSDHSNRVGLSWDRQEDAVQFLNQA